MKPLTIDLRRALACSCMLFFGAPVQAEVRIYGVFDLGVSVTRSGASRIGREDSSLQQGSRLGLAGTEQLGNGWSAEFVIENGFNGDDGTIAQGERVFGRQSYVGLVGDLGAVRLGRQWMPSYTVLDDLDPFGAALAGDASLYFGSNIYVDIDIRMDNSLTYAFGAGGLSTVLAYGLGSGGERGAGQREFGLSSAYQRGNVSVEFGQHTIDLGAGSHIRSTIAGGAYQFGLARVHVAYGIDTSATRHARTHDRQNMLIGAVIPITRGSVLLSHVRQKDRINLSRTDQYAIGYSYLLSERTNLYTSAGHIRQKHVTTLDAGIRHLF